MSPIQAQNILIKFILEDSVIYLNKTEHKRNTVTILLTTSVHERHIFPILLTNVHQRHVLTILLTSIHGRHVLTILLTNFHEMMDDMFLAVFLIDYTSLHWYELIRIKKLINIKYIIMFLYFSCLVRHVVWCSYIIIWKSSCQASIKRHHATIICNQ